MTSRGTRFIKQRAQRAALSDEQFRRDFYGIDRPEPAPLNKLENRARKLWLALQSHDEELHTRAQSFFSMCGDDLRAEVMKLAGADEKFKRPRQRIKIC